MYRVNSLTIIFYIYSEFLTQSAFTQSSSNKLNVIIFFTETSKIPDSDDGIKFLQMHEMARRNLNPRKIQNVASRRNLENCKLFLDQGLESLSHFCQNALGMKTAIKSACTRYPKSRNANHGLINFQNTIPRRKNTNLKKDAIPAVVESKVYDKNDIISSPEHTEVFKIRVRRNVGLNADEIDDDYTPRPKWNVLDILSHIRMSFIENLLNDEKKHNLANAPDDILSGLIKYDEYDSNLFRIVSTTLEQLQEAPCEGFLMVIFGGHLHEISDIYSPLIQSLKHVIESTDPQKTLLIVTAACPESTRTTNGVVVVKEDATKSQNTYPIYARGPKSERLTQCTKLYDIPVMVKNILEEIFPTFEGPSIVL